MKHLLWLLFLPFAAHAVTNPCPQSSGGLTVPAFSPRVSGISPLLVFFDNSGVTSTAVVAPDTPFQDVYSSWDSGDTLGSGNGTWAFGSYPSHNLKRYGTGNVFAHLYVTEGRDTKYTATITSSDGVNQVSCSIGITVFDPSGPNGFPGTATTCIAATTTPVAGSGGCPAGAGVLQQSNASTAWTSKGGSGKRLLFKCGDTFSGAVGIAFTVVTSRLGAYGGCENTTTNRPIFTGSIGMNASNTSTGPTDVAFSDIDCEGGGTYCIGTNGGYNMKQLTVYNMKANNTFQGFYFSGTTQTGVIGSVDTASGATQHTYINYGNNNCVNNAKLFNCGQGSSPVFNVIDYQALIGNDFDGINGPPSTTGGFWETVRIGACRLCYTANNNFLNGDSNGGAVLKYHNGNALSSQLVFLGQYTEFTETSDNKFGGTSGSQVFEFCPENSNYDERLRNSVIERNVFNGASPSENQLVISGVNITARENMFKANANDNVKIAKRGIEGTGTSGAPVDNFWPEHNVVINNTMIGGAAAIEYLAGGFGTGPGNNNVFINNLCYQTTCGSTNGSGNVNTTNSTNTALNPNFVNIAGFTQVPDFKPQANFSPATNTPANPKDALQANWSPTWSLGAVHP